MSRPELHESLTALITALDSDQIEESPSVVSASVTLPVELHLESHEGKVTAFAAPPTSRWESGLMAQTHRITFTATREEIAE